MISVEVGGKAYELKDAWSDVTLEDAKRIYLIDIPENLKALYQATTEEEQQEAQDKIDLKEITKTFPAYYGEVMGVLTTIPKTKIKRILSGERAVIYGNYLRHIVQGLYSLPDFTPTGMESFEHKGARYYLPETRTALGEDKPGAWLTALEFAEAADLEYHSKQMEAGRYEVAANIVSILCRPKGEPYDEDTALQRAKEFADLPMSIVWEVFFSTIQSTNRYVLHTATSSLRRQAVGAARTGYSGSDGTAPLSRRQRFSERLKTLKKRIYGSGSTY